VQQNTHPIGTRDTRKKNELMYGILNETKINMVTHVIRGQPFYFRGRGLHWIWQNPINFLSAKTKSTHLLLWTLAQAFIPSKKLQAKARGKKMSFWKIIHYQGVHHSLIIYFQYFGNELIYFHCDGDHIVYFHQKKNED